MRVRSTWSSPTVNDGDRSNRGTRRTASSTCGSRDTRARSTADDVTGIVVHTDLRRTGWFRVQRRAAEPPPRGRGVELPRQRLRHPDRLPAARASRAGPATGRSSRPPRRSCTTWPGSPPSGCATSRPTSAPTASSATSRPTRAGGARPRECDRRPSSRARRAGATPPCIVPWAMWRVLRRPTAPRGAVAERWCAWVDFAAGAARAGRHARARRRSTAGRAAHEAVPVGHRLPLG